MMTLGEVPAKREEMEPGLIRLLAPNPSPMTLHGTNTYLIGESSLAVIDPGPANDAHLQAILDAAAGRPIEAIFVTHSHVDHSRLAPALAREAGAPVLAFGDSTAGRSPLMEALAKEGGIGGGEGVDAGFRPVRRLADGEVVRGADWEITALHTPGHFGNHMCFSWNGALFTGDHVMGWASSLVSPPDGNLAHFMASCRRLLTREDRILYPGHGAPVRDPRKRIGELIAHREMREAQIVEALRGGPLTPAEITARIYRDTPPALLAMAERNVLAHLLALMESGRAEAVDKISSKARFRLTDTGGG